MRDAEAVRSVWVAQNTPSVEELFVTLIRQVRIQRRAVYDTLEELVVPEAIDIASHQLIDLDKLLSHLSQGLKNWEAYQAALATATLAERAR